jgi:nitrous oxidase accessory protein NosD
MKGKHTFMAVFLATTAVAGCAETATIEVSQGQSIQAALDRAKPGDTVAVRAGTYYESVYAHASGVKLISVDGNGAAHIVSKDRTALFLQGGSGTEIRGFRVTAGPNGNGIQVGGAASGGVIRNYAEGYVVADNIIHDAGLDGIKVHQAKGFTFTGNVIENAGTGNKGNYDGGIDFVSVTDSVLKGNTIVKTGGNSCLMLKGGTARNLIIGNSFGGCKDAIHLGGFTFAGPKPGVKEAYDNKISRNNLCAIELVFRLFPGEKARGDNLISGNKIAQGDGCSAKGGELDTAPVDHNNTGGGSMN